MFGKIDKILKQRIDEVGFIELKPEAEILIHDEKLDHKNPLPILIKDIVDKVNGIGSEDLNTANIMNGMAFMLGVDDGFEYNDYYKKILMLIDEKIGVRLFGLALEMAENNNRSTALIYFNAAKHFMDDELNVLYNYGRCAEELGNLGHIEDEEEDYLNEAFETFKYISEKFPESPLGYYHMGFYFVNKKQYETAMNIWGEALKLDLDGEKRSELLNHLSAITAKVAYEQGYNLVLDGRQQEGLEKLLPLEEEHLDWWNLLFFIGLAYRMEKDYEKAINYFQKVTVLNTGHVETFNEIGLCYMSMDYFEQAYKVFEEAVKMNPNNSELLCNQGISALQLQRFDEAESLLMEAQKINPEDDIITAWLREVEKVRYQETNQTLN